MSQSALPGMRQWIWRAFARSALVPLVLVEMVLIAVYLFSNTAIRDEQVGHLRRMVLSDLQGEVRQEARMVELQLSQLATLATTYRNLTATTLQAELAVEPAMPRLALTPDGVRFSPEDQGGSAVFYSGITPPERQDLRKVARMATLDPLMKELVRQNPLVASIYFNSWDSYNHIYPWFRTDEQYPHDMDISKFNFYYLADAQHNPQRKQVWTDVYLDPAGQGWMMSAIAPVYRGDLLEGVVGVDVTVGELLGRVIRQTAPWGGYTVLVSDQLNIMALPKPGERDFGLDELTSHSYEEAIRQELFKPEDFNLGKRADMQALATAMRQAPEGVQHMQLRGQSRLLAWTTIEQTGWHLLTVVDEAAVFADTDALARRYQGVGYLLIGGLVLFYLGFFAFMWLRARWLSRRLLQPIEGVNAMMGEIGSGHWDPPQPQAQIAELAVMVARAARMGSQLQHSEAQRQRTHDRLELVLASATESLWEIDSRSGQIALRGRFCERFGVTSAVQSEHDFLQRVHPEDRAAVQQLKSDPSDSLVREAEFRFRDLQGNYHWLLARGRVIERDPQTGAVLLLAGTHIDIAALKQTEWSLRTAMVEAQAASQAKSRFISSVSHELRTPLNIIHGFAQLMQVEGRSVDAQQALYLEEILLASQHLTQLVGDILDWASIQAERPKMEPVPVSLAAILRECAELVKLQVESAGLSFELDLPGRELQVLADPRRLRQVLLNLLSNAIKYNRPRGRVRLGWHLSGTQVRLQVEDTGMGIRPELQALLFEPFQRIGRENTAIQGTGIGLALCQEFAGLMQGQMGLQSEPGIGSCFWIELPLLCSAPQPVTGSGVEAQVARVAYVGERVDEQQLACRVLQNLAEIVIFNNGTQALEGLQQAPVDLLLLDLGASSLDGEILLRALRELPQARTLPVIVLSAVEEAERISAIGCQCLLRKPVDPEELHSLVAALLHEKISNAR